MEEAGHFPSQWLETKSSLNDPRHLIRLTRSERDLFPGVGVGDDHMNANRCGRGRCHRCRDTMRNSVD